MRPPPGDMPVIHVLIGQVHVVRSAHLLFAVLGSCVGIALSDRHSRVGGMAHVLLPDSRGQQEPRMPGKYADLAVDCLVDSLLALGAKLEHLEANLAGGAALCSRGDPHAAIGEANASAVRDHLRRRSVLVRERHLGGVLGRKVTLESHSGVFQVDNLQPTQLNEDALKGARS